MSEGLTFADQGLESKNQEERHMLKYLLYTIAALVAVSLVGSGIHLYRVAQKNKKEMSQYEGPAVAVDQSLGKVLVVYYSLSGHTKEIAEKIKDKTGGDIYEIKTLEKIDTSPWFYLTLKQQVKKSSYPALVGEFPDFSTYDVVFVGAPVWWYTVATPVFSFLQVADFQGKKVVPFSTQGSNAGTFFEDFAAHAQNAEILKGASFNNLSDKYRQAEDNKIGIWINAVAAEMK